VTFNYPIPLKKFKNLVKILLFLPLFFLSEDILAQKRSRLDISISRNRYMTKQLNSVKEELELSKARVNEQAGTINQYVSEVERKNDSIRTQKERFERALLIANYQIAALDDSLKEYREYRAQVHREKLKVVQDSTIIRVYELPLGQVRVRTLRKVLDQGVDLLIERNTDEGFVISKVFQDRKSPNLFKKYTDTRVEAEIRMIEHPFYPNRTLFYMDLEAQERDKKKKPFVEITDPLLLDRYEKKLLDFFDRFLTAS
jgi:hypothetical protein